MRRQKTAEQREGLVGLRAACWASYLKDTRQLRGEEYYWQEGRSWRRLKGRMAMLRRQERALDLEDEHR